MFCLVKPTTWSRALVEMLKSLASQKISSLLWNPTFHYCDHKNPQLVPILSRIHPGSKLRTCFFQTSFNIKRILPPTPRPHKWSLVTLNKYLTGRRYDYHTQKLKFIINNKNYCPQYSWKQSLQIMIPCDLFTSRSTSKAPEQRPAFTTFLSGSIQHPRPWAKLAALNLYRLSSTWFVSFMQQNICRESFNWFELKSSGIIYPLKFVTLRQLWLLHMLRKNTLWETSYLQTIATFWS
jgi:hypothetical protein